MNNIKKINFLLCLIFSFVFFFSNVFQVEATTCIKTYEDIVLETTPGPKDSKVFACKFTCITLDNGEREVVWAITDINAWRKAYDGDWFRYSCSKANYEISEDGLSAKIFVTLDEYRSSKYNEDLLDMIVSSLHHEKYNLTFELNLD